jgi:hypothetical protein
MVLHPDEQFFFLGGSTGIPVPTALLLQALDPFLDEEQIIQP